jgi:hypothetical protein
MRCEKPILLTLIQTHDDILKGVKMESSYLAKRKSDAQGNDLLDILVFDEEYLVLFRSLFFSTRSKLTSACSAYLKLPDDPAYFDSQDFSTEKDYVIQLFMPSTFLMPIRESIAIEMKDYIIAYIMYRWLETKLPNEAGIYKVRSNEHLDELKKYLGMRTKPTIRRGQYF